MSEKREVITEISNITDFQAILLNNPGLVVLKLGAEWCGPCKKIQNDVVYAYARFPASVQPVMLDIDEAFELFAFLKKKKRVNGVPALLAWKKGNTSDIPDDVVLGADVAQVRGFFERCFRYANQSTMSHNTVSELDVTQPA
jgi:thiol-disulfide isomerase/thioredoxin